MPSHDPASHEPELSDSGMSSPDADGGPLDAGARDVMPMDSGQSDAGEPSIPEPDGGEHDAGAEAVRLPGFVEVPWVVDMAADREMLYVVSGWSQLYRHFLDGHAPDPEPLDLGVGVPSGVDVSPDMKWLVVADGSLREGWLGCNLVELATGEVRWVDVDRAEPGETGTFMPQFIAEHTVLLTIQGSMVAAPTYRVRALDVEAEGVSTDLPPGMQGRLTHDFARIARSADGKVLVTAEYDQGALVKYSLGEEHVTESLANLTIDEVALSRDGSELAAVTSRGVLIEQKPYERVRLGNAVDMPLGAVYSPVADVLYVAWNYIGGSVAAYDTNTWKPLSILRDSTLTKSGWAGEFGDGHLRISGDGKTLFAKVEGGVSILPVGNEAEAGEGADIRPIVDRSIIGTPREDTALILAHLPVAGVQDVAHDAQRNALYVSTLEGGFRGQILRWDLGQGRGAGSAASVSSLLQPALDGNLRALALSPDQQTLVAVDADPAPASIVFFVVDLGTPSVRRVAVPKRAQEHAAHSAVFLDDQTILLSSSTAPESTDTVPLRRIGLHDGKVSEPAEVGARAELVRSADGKYVALTWPGTTPAVLVRYEVASGKLEQTSLASHALGVAVDRSGARAALVTQNDGTLVLDRAGSVMRVLDRSIGSGSRIVPTRALYSPVTDVLYLAWPEASAEFMRPPLGAYDANTFEQLAIVESGELYPEALRISRDGSRLFAVYAWGVGVYQLSTP
jgi:hypothetical protein